MSAPVIYINGYPGVGKLTVARTLQTLLPSSAIVDNHTLIDPVEKHVQRGSAFYQDRCGEYRWSILKPIAEDPKLADTVYIFTDSQTEHNDVILECAYEENVKRLTMAGRGGSLNGKLTDPEKVREYREKGSGIWKFHDSDEMVLDITETSPLEAAGKIRSFILRREEEGRIYGDWEEV